MKDGLTAQPDAEASPADSGAHSATSRFFRRIGRPLHLLRNLSLLLFLFFFSSSSSLFPKSFSSAGATRRRPRSSARGRNASARRARATRSTGAPFASGRSRPPSCRRSSPRKTPVSSTITASIGRRSLRPASGTGRTPEAEEDAFAARRRSRSSSRRTCGSRANAPGGGRGARRSSPSALDLLVPKARILEIYLSAIEFGETTYGCEAASRALFGVSASRLSAPQAARLAALIPGPAWYRAHPAAWERRAELIAQRMESQPLPAGLTAPAR